MKQKLLLLIFVIFQVLPGLGHDFKYTYKGQTITYTVIDEVAKLCRTKAGKVDHMTAGNKVSGDLVIPEIAIDGKTDYHVSEIGYRGFLDCNELTSVVIPNSVKHIGDYAFYNCTGLSSLEIGNSVTVIGKGAFHRCDSLTSIVIPSSVSSIGDLAFDCSLKDIVVDANNQNYSSIDGVLFNKEGSILIRFPAGKEGNYTIPNTVTSIGEAAFIGCRDLTSVTIPNTVTQISDYAFSECVSLQSVIIPSSVTGIGIGAFSLCVSLTSIEIPNSITEIGIGAFSTCLSLTSIEIPNSITEIRAGTFQLCSSLTSIIIPDSVTSIGDSAFELCESLASFKIPDLATSIGDCAFSGCAGLPIIEIPSSVREIGVYAFHRCLNMTAIKVISTIPIHMADNSFEGLYDNTILSVPDKAVNHYLATNWSLFTNIRTNDADIEIGKYSDGVLEYRLNPTDHTATVVGAKNYANLQIPERFTDDTDSSNPTRYYIKAIGYKAFSDKDVNEIEFNSRSQLELIGDYAFQGARIDSINIPSTVKAIGNNSFENCSSLKNAILPEGLKTIGISCFANSGLTSISVPSTVIEIKEAAFFDATKLEKVDLQEGLVSIGARTFAASQNRTVSSNPLFIPSSVSIIGEDAFLNYDISQVEIADLTSWCNIEFGNERSNPINCCGNLFLDGKELTILDIPKGIENIKSYAFAGFTTLKKVSLPTGLKSVGNFSFNNCNKVIRLSIPASVVEIGRSAFACKSVTFEDGFSPINIQDDSFYIGIDSLYCGRPMTNMTLNVKDLTYLTIGQLIEEIPEGKFCGASNLQTLNLGSAVQSIGTKAFSGCTHLTEVIMPPTVVNIGTEAFSEDSQLKSIVMGYSVKNIGEKAFDGCAATIVCITAQTPPTAPNNTFSRYSGKLYLQGRKAMDAYYDAFTCWDRFNSYEMTEPTEIKMEGETTISGKPGDTFQLTAVLIPENITLPYIFWRSTNPEIATVNKNGTVTVNSNLDEVIPHSSESRGCRIIAESLYADGPIAEVLVSVEDSDVEEIKSDSFKKHIDFGMPYDVYNINGVKVADATKDELVKGIYIVRQGNVAEKIVVR